MTRRKLVLLSALGLAACSAKENPARGELMVVLGTDMSVPKDLTDLSVKVSVGAEVAYQRDFELAPSGAFRVPGTLAIVAGSGGSDVQLEITGIHRRNGGSRVARTFAKATTTVPQTRIALLRMPAQWLCEGSALELAFDDFTSSCSSKPGEPEQACVAGACQPVMVAEASLPDYAAADVFGGGAAKPKDPLGQCFDVVKCFASGRDMTPDAACKLPIVDDGRPINVGLRLHPGGDGICDAAQPNVSCTIALDQDATFGWTRNAEGDLQLPPAVCERLASGALSGLAVTRSCITKTPQFPTCGAWSSVGH